VAASIVKLPPIPGRPAVLIQLYCRCDLHVLFDKAHGCEYSSIFPCMFPSYFYLCHNTLKRLTECMNHQDVFLLGPKGHAGQLRHHTYMVHGRSCGLLSQRETRAKWGVPYAVYSARRRCVYTQRLDMAAAHEGHDAPV
jgi:hypothetical protein